MSEFESESDYPRWCTDDCRALYERLKKSELWDCCVLLILSEHERLLRTLSRLSLHARDRDNDTLTTAGMYIATYVAAVADPTRSTP